MNRVGICRKRRERLARLVSSHRPLANLRGWPTRAASSQRAETWRLHVSALKAALEREGMGRRVVSARLLRRRNAARLCRERRMPHRFDRAILGRDFRRRRSGSRERAPWRRSRNISFAATTVSSSSSPRLSTRRPRPGLHQRISARRPRKRRPIHPCGDLVRARLRRARRRRQGRRTFLALEPDQSCRAPAPAFIATRSSPMSSPPIFMPNRRTSGRGGWTWYTGSAGWMYRAGIEWILGFRLRGARLYFDPCIPRAWRGFEITFRYHSSRYEIVVENPHGRCARGVVR